MRTRVAVTALAAFSIALAGCAPKQTTSLAKPGATAGAAVQAPEALCSPSYWRLTELRGRQMGPPVEGKKGPSVVFEREGSKVHGFGGCSNFTGNCEYMAGNRLRISKIAVALKACPDMTIEDEFLRALQTADNYYTDGKVLKLHRGKMAPLAVLEAVSG